MSTAVVILADGFEEIEAVTQIDVLRRAGVEVVVAGLARPLARGAHGISVGTDVPLSELSLTPDLLVLPGGMPGAKSLGESEQVLTLLRNQHVAGRLIGAICAAPAFAPVKAGVLEGKRATCYPSFERFFGPGITFVDENVVVDGTVVTSRGPGTAAAFALTLVERLVGKVKAEEVRAAMLYGERL